VRRLYVFAKITGFGIGLKIHEWKNDFGSGVHMVTMKERKRPEHP